MTSKADEINKEIRVKEELERLYPGMTNAQITAINRDRLKRLEEHPLIDEDANWSQDAN